MEKSPAANFRKNLAAVSLIAAPALLLIGDLFGFGRDFYYARYFFCKAALAIFVFAILAIVHLLKPRADRLGLIGGGLAITGAISGTTLFSFVYLHDEMIAAAAAAGFDAGAMQSCEQIFRRVFSIMVHAPLPGLAFPIGLFTLSVGLSTTKIVPRWAAAALGLGAILFPVGRIPGILSVSIASDVFLVVSMCFIGWKTLIDSEGWD